MNNSHELKGLQVRKNRLLADIDSLEQERNSLNSEISDKKQELNRIDQKIKSFAKSEPVVTEHALLRYVERVLGINLTEIQNRILTEHNRKAIDFSPNCKIKSEGVEFVVKDRKVISVI